MPTVWLNNLQTPIQIFYFIIPWTFTQTEHEKYFRLISQPFRYRLKESSKLHLSHLNFAVVAGCISFILFSFFIVFFPLTFSPLITLSPVLVLYTKFYLVWILTVVMINWKYAIGPPWCGSVVWVATCEPESCWLDSQSGHSRPGPQLGACERQPVDVSLTHWCFFPSLLLSPCL